MAIKRLLPILLLFAAALNAQAAHQVVLTVTSADTTSTSPGTATIVRAAGICPSAGVPASGTTLTSALSVPGTASYTDSTVVGGNSYCYWATLKTAGGGSGVSNTFLGTISVSVKLTGTAQ